MSNDRALLVGVSLMGACGLIVIVGGVLAGSLVFGSIVVAMALGALAYRIISGRFPPDRAFWMAALVSVASMGILGIVTGDLRWVVTLTAVIVLVLVRRSTVSQ